MSIYPEETLRAIRSKLDPKAVLALIDYRRDTIRDEGAYIRCFCPIHKEVIFRTLAIEIKTGRYRCSYNLCKGAKDGDLIDLFARCGEMEYDEAAALLVHKLGLDVEIPPTAEFLDKTLEISGNYMELGELDEAERGFQKIISIQPENDRAWRGLLRVYELKQDEPRRIEAIARLAELLIERGDFEEARPHCDLLLEKSPEREKALSLGARCFLGLKDYARALDTYMRLADQLEMQGQFTRAIEIYREVERLNLDIVDVYPHIINAMMALDRAEDVVTEMMGKAARFEEEKDWDRALDCMRYIFEVDVQRDDVRRRFIETAMRAGLTGQRIDQTLDVLEELVQRHALNDAADMLESLKQALAGHPRFLKLATLIHRAKGDEQAAMESQISLADHLIQHGGEAQARGILEELRQGSPDSIAVLSRLAQLYRKAGDKIGAVKAFQTLIGLLERDGKIEEALPIAQTLAELTPEDVEPHFEYVRLALAGNQTAQAAEHVEQMLDRLAAAGKHGLTLELIERHGLLLADRGRVLSLKARCLESAGRLDDARGALLEACQAYKKGGQEKEAVALLKEHLRKNPSDAAARDFLSEIDERSRVAGAMEAARQALLASLARPDPDAAARALDRFLDVAPSDAESLEGLLPQLVEKGMAQAVAKTCDHLISVFTSRGATNKALEYAAKRLSATPDDNDAFEKALGLARAARRFGPVAEALLDWARAREDAGQASFASDTLHALLEEFPDENQLRANYLVFLAEGEQNAASEERANEAAAEWARSRSAAEAEKTCRQHSSEDPDNLLWGRLLLTVLRETRQEDAYLRQCFEYAQSLSRNRRWPEAVDVLSELLQRDPAQVAAREQMIVALRTLRRLSEAVTHSIRLAGVLRERNEHERAETVLCEAAETAPDEPSVQRALAECLERAGKPAQAIEARLRLADLLERRGATEDAAAELQAILDREPSRPGVADRLESLEGQIRSRNKTVEQLEEVAQRHFNAGAYDKALATLEEILANDNSRLSALNLRAQCFARAGEEKRALDEFLRISDFLKTPPPAKPRDEEAVLDDVLELVKEYSFEQFVVGAPNNFAYATALAVARAPALEYNPLFLYSDVGLGKTHLINAIANHLAATQPQMKIVYMGADDFAAGLLEAISNNRVRAFRSRFRNASVLLIDDVHFLAGKERAQEEFFNIFNALFQAKKQIVITSDRPPKELAHLEKRLRSRFSAGVVVDIQPPDEETRAAILLRERAALGLNDKAPDEVIEEIARRVNSNIRELKAAFKQVVAKAQMTGQKMTAELARQVIDRL